MRSGIAISAKGLQFRAIAGTHVVLLAMNCSASYRQGLIGFAIERKDDNGTLWLPALKTFNRPAGAQDRELGTRNNPIQKFHWGDYTVRPDNRYTYTVHALRGEAGALQPDDAVSVEVRSERPESLGRNGHAVYFNRSVAASQSFASRFPNLPGGDVVDPAAREWLSRGLAEALVRFIDATEAGQALHLMVYEFEKPEFLAALKRALDRGVRLEILYDGLIDMDGKGPSADSVPAIAEAGLKAVCRPRTGAGLAISHNKFMVRCRADGQPLAVWTGSTNFTDAAVYGQSNVGHVVADPAVAQPYLDWHQTLWSTAGSAQPEPGVPVPADLSATASRATVMALTPMPAPDADRSRVVLSPRKTIEAVTACAQHVLRAQRMVCFTAPFAMHDDLEAALAESPAQVFGLLNQAGVVGPALHQAPNTELASAAAITDKTVLGEWQGKLMRESLHHSGVFIHSKVILVDPLSDAPLVITGSANFSTNSCKNNDENQLFIPGEAAVADVYLGEFMRMFDHYQFRSAVKAAKEAKAGSPAADAAFLTDSDAWTQRYFAGDRVAARLAFFG